MNKNKYYYIIGCIGVSFGLIVGYYKYLSNCISNINVEYIDYVYGENKITIKNEEHFIILTKQIKKAELKSRSIFPILLDRYNYLLIKSKKGGETKIIISDYGNGADYYIGNDEYEIDYIYPIIKYYNKMLGVK